MRVSKMVKATFAISGMDCGSCAATIQKAVGKVKGVQAAQVNFAGGKMDVDYDPRAAKPEDIRAAVKKAGYDAV